MVKFTLTRKCACQNRRKYLPCRRRTSWATALTSHERRHIHSQWASMPRPASLQIETKTTLLLLKLQFATIRTYNLSNSQINQLQTYSELFTHAVVRQHPSLLFLIVHVRLKRINSTLKSVASGPGSKVTCSPLDRRQTDRQTDGTAIANSLSNVNVSPRSLKTISCTEVCWWHARHCIFAVR